MATALVEKNNSREWRGGSVILRFVLTGASDDATAKAYLLANAPSTHAGLVRDENVGMDAAWVDTGTTDGLWDCEVTYNPPGVAEPLPMVALAVAIRVSTTGGTQHITQSKATTERYVPAGAGKPDFKGAIGVTDTSVDGCDISVGVFNFTVTKVFAAASLPALGTVYGLTGKTNAASFTVADTRTSLSLTFAIGECLFLGVEGGDPRSDGTVEFSYTFAASPAKTGLVVGDITGIAKGGWEYLWVRYADTDDTTAKIPVRRPLAAVVERVYDSGDFTGLGL